MDFEIKLIPSSSVETYIEDIAKLRISVFKEFPYLYDGYFEYEKTYLQTYINSPNSLVILAFQGPRIIGVSTCLPLQDESDDFKRPLVNRQFDLNNIFYFGESVVLHEFRGKGLGYKFFELREQHAQKTMESLQYTAFCAVQRSSQHPLKPLNYKPLNQFWNRLGYDRRDDLVATFKWKDIDHTQEDEKSLVYWIKRWP